VDDAKRICEQMILYGYKPDVTHLVSILDSMRGYGHFPGLTNLLEGIKQGKAVDGEEEGLKNDGEKGDLQKQRVPTSGLLFGENFPFSNAAVDTSVADLLFQMPLSIPTAPITAAASAYQVGNKVEMADKLVQEVLSDNTNGEPPQLPHGHDDLLRKLFSNNQVKRAMETFDKLKKEGAIITQETFEVMTEGLVNNKQIEKALKFIERIKNEEGLYLKVETYNLFIETCLKDGRLQDAWNVMEKMNEAGVSPTLSTYETFMQGCVSSRFKDEPTKILRKMTEEGVLPQESTFRILIHGLAFQGLVDEALKPLQLMRDLKMDVSTGFESMIRGMVEGKMPMSVCEKKFQMIFDEELQPTNDTYTLMVNGFLDEGRTDKATTTTNLMKFMKLVNKL